MTEKTVTIGKDPFVLVYRHNDGEGGHDTINAMEVMGGSKVRGVIIRTRTAEFTNAFVDPPSPTVSEALVFIPGAKLVWDDAAQHYEIQ